MRKTSERIISLKHSYRIRSTLRHPWGNLGCSLLEQWLGMRTDDSVYSVISLDSIITMLSWSFNSSNTGLYQCGYNWPKALNSFIWWNKQLWKLYWEWEHLARRVMLWLFKKWCQKYISNTVKIHLSGEMSTCNLSLSWHFPVSIVNGIWCSVQHTWCFRMFRRILNWLINYSRLN